MQFYGLNAAWQSSGICTIVFISSVHTAARTGGLHKAVSFQVKNSYNIEKEDDEDGSERRRESADSTSGHLQILSAGRNLATRVMSNGVEVIVKGDKTDYIFGGYRPDRTPSPPLRAKHTTLPPSTVSRQFQLVEQSGKPYQQINSLLHSIVRSATPDLITKTLVTTFTYMTTMLQKSSTVVNTREQIISNVVTENFRPTALYTANLKAEPSPLSPLDDDTLYSSYVTNTLMTTYTYYNAFTAGTVPIVLTSKETVSNVLTVPAYLAASPTPTPQPFSSRIFETETYFTTFTFSKTVAEANTNRIITTMETVTQVVVTEALVPATSPIPTPVPSPTVLPPETKFTTVTFFTTSLRGFSPVLKSSTKVMSEVITPTLVSPSLTVDVHPTLLIPTESFHVGPSVTTAQTIKVSPTVMKPKNPYQPLVIYATKTYYTTFTYFTTVLGEGSSTKVHSRIQVASKVVTEALSTRGPLGTDYLLALKSSYLAKHSTLFHVSSSIKEIIPAKTESVLTMSPTLVTQSFSHPHYPKDEDLPGILDPTLDPTTPGTGSAEHYEELKEGISHIVSVLKDSQDEYELIAPTTVEPLFSTIVAPTTVKYLSPLASHLVAEDDESDPTTESGSFEFNNEVSHRPTPPLKSSLSPSGVADRPFDDHLFTMVTGAPVHALIYEEEYEGTTEKETEKHPKDPGSSSVEEAPLAHNDKPVTLDVDSLESSLILTPSILDKIDMAGPPASAKPIIPVPADLFVTKVPAELIKSTPSVDRTQQIFNMLSDIITGQENLPDYYDELKEQDAFAEHFSEETTTKKVYTLSSNATELVVKVKPQKPTKRPKPPTSSVLNLFTDTTRRPKPSISTFQTTERETTRRPKPPDSFDGEPSRRPQISQSSATLNLFSENEPTRHPKPPASSEREPPRRPKPPNSSEREPTKRPTASSSSILNLSTERYTTKHPKPPSTSMQDYFMEKVMTTEASITDTIFPLTPAPTPSTRPQTLITESTTERPTTHSLQTNLAQDSEHTTEAPTTSRRTTTNTPKTTSKATTIRRPPTTTPSSPLAVKIESFENVGDHGQTHHVTTAQTFFPDIGKFVITLTSSKPEDVTTPSPAQPLFINTRRSTTPRPRKKPRPKPTHETEIEDKKVYNLGQETDESSQSDEDEEPEDTSDAADESEEVFDIKPPNFDGEDDDDGHQDDHNSGPPPISAPPAATGGGGTGPSKSSGLGAIGIGAGSTGGSHILSASTNGFNWTPLLNLGALGLGGLGASTLTKLGPMWSTISGYMKSALPLAGIARNDTHKDKHKIPIDEHTLYSHHPMGPNFVRVNSNGPPTVHLEPNRPIVLTQGAEPSYQVPPVNSPNVYHQFAASNNNNNNNNNFPPNNFVPPHDKQPNLFAQFPEVSHPPRSSEVQHGQKFAPGPINSIHGSGSQLRPHPPSAPPTPGLTTHTQVTEEHHHHVVLPSAPTTQDTRTPPKLMTKHKLHETFLNRPYEILPAVLDSDELTSFEIVEQVPSGLSQKSPTPTAGSGPNFSSSPKPPANIKDIINSGQSPTPFTPYDQRPLHHMDKVYYNNNNEELKGSPENPFLTISVEKPPPTGNSANAPVRISFSSPGTNSGPANTQSQPQQRPYSHAESNEHDSFVPPPKFPPANSLQHLPTPPPMARPTRMPVNRGPTVPSPSTTTSENSPKSSERFPKIPFPSRNRPFIAPMKHNIWSRLNGTSHEILGPIQGLPPYRLAEASNNVPQRPEQSPGLQKEPNRFMTPPSPNPPPPNSLNLGQSHKVNPFNVPLNRRPIGPLKTSQEQMRHPGGSAERPFRPNFGSPEQGRPNSHEQQRPGSQERPQLRPQGSHERPVFVSHENRPGPIGPPVQSQEFGPHQGPIRPPVTGHRPPVLIPAMPVKPQNLPHSQEQFRPPVQNQPNSQEQLLPPQPNSQEQFRRPPQQNSQEQFRPQPNSQEQFRRPPNSQEQFRPPPRRPIGPPLTSSELHSFEVVNLPGGSQERRPVDFGDKAQEQRPHPVLLPGFQQIPWTIPPSEKPPSTTNERPSSLENHRLPSGFVRPIRPTGSVVRVTQTTPTPPTTSTLIIKEITSPRAPIGGFRNISSQDQVPTTRTPNRATISKLNFVRRFTTRPPSTTPSTGNFTKFGHINSFVISPTHPDILKIQKDSSKESSEGGKISSLFPNKRPQLSRFPFRSTTRKPFDVTKYFSQAANDTNVTHETGASEDKHFIIDPVDQTIIKSPFDKVDTVSFTRPTQVTTTSTTAEAMTSSEELEAQEDELLNKIKISGFPFVTPKDFDDLWWPTTFKPFPSDSYTPKPTSISTTQKSQDSPTTFRNTVKPTTFRPNGAFNRTFLQGLAGSGFNRTVLQGLANGGNLVRNQLTRLGSSTVNYVDDNVGMEDVKIKNVEIHKIPEFVKKPGDSKESTKFNENYSETASSEEYYEEVEVSREKPRPSQESDSRPALNSEELPKPPTSASTSTERPNDNEFGNTVVPMPATALTPPAPPPGYLDPNNPRLRPPVGAVVHFSPNGPVPSGDLLRRPTDQRPDVLPRPQPPQFNQQNLGMRQPFQPQLIPTGLHPPAPSQNNGAPMDPSQNNGFRPHDNGPDHSHNNGFRPHDNGPPIDHNNGFRPHDNGPQFDARPPHPPPNRPGLIRRPIQPPQRRPDFGPDHGPRPNGPIRHPVHQQGQRPYPGPEESNRPDSGPDGRPRHPIRRPPPPRNHPENHGPFRNPVRRPIDPENRPELPPRPPQGPIRRPGPFNNRDNPFMFKRPTAPTSQETTTESTTSSTTTRRPIFPIRTSTQDPIDSQEYSEETDSNEIIIDNMKSTTENQNNIAVQNQQKSTTEDHQMSSTSARPTVLVDHAVAATSGHEDSEEYSDEFEESEKIPKKPISSEKVSTSTEKPSVSQSAENSAKNSIERPQVQQPPFLRRPIHAGGHLNGHFVRRPQRPGRPQSQERPSQENLEPPQRRPQHPSQENPSTNLRPPQRIPPERPQILRPNIDGTGRQPVRRPNQPPFRPPVRPNLLRPPSDLFKPEPSPTLQTPRVTVHTIASVDDDNKIIGTNVFTAVLPSHEIMKSKLAESEIQASESLSTELLLTTPALDEGESTLNPTSVIKYSSGTLQTVSSYDVRPPVVSPSEDSEEYSDEYEGEDDDNDVRPPPIRPSVTRTIIRTRFQPSSATPALTSTPAVTSESSSHRTEVVTSVTSPTSRFVFPTRKPFTRPPLVKTTTEAEETTESKIITTSRRPFVPFRNVTVTVPWSRRRTTDKPVAEDTETAQNATRKFPARRPFVPFTTTTTTTEEPSTRSTTFRPFRRPGTMLTRNTTTTSTTTTTEPNTESQEMEEAQHRPVRPSESSTSDKSGSDESDEEGQTVKPDETSKVVSHVQTSVNFKINPTRVLHRGKPKGQTGQSVKPTPDENEFNTRFITHTETQTQTITETETTVMTSQGQPVTHTVMITKTLPPQTLISTIVGTVTVVNSVEVKPTTVRTTIYTEPTIIIPAPPVDPPQQTTKRTENSGGVIPISRGNVILAGGSRGPPSSTPTASLTTEESTEKGKIGPPELECIANCSHEKNQVCRRYANGTRSHCVCRPGYARLKPTIPCKPTYTYELSMRLSNMDETEYNLRDLKHEATDDYQNFIRVTKEALDKTFMRTDVRTKFMGAEVMKVMPKKIKDRSKNISESEVNVAFLVQLSLNVSEELIKNQFVRQLKSSNFSIGQSGIASSSNANHYAARDFDECSHPDYNDCSKDADCINIKGSFTCKCRPGFLDRSRKDSPGRDCRAMDGCPECSYQGKCVLDPFGNPACNCFRWYGGSQCQINLKVLLISIIVIGFVLFILVLLCGIMMCRRKKPQPRERTGSGRFLRYRSPTSQATLDRAAIMHESCSSDGSETPVTRMNPLPSSFTPDSLLVDTVEKNFMRDARENDVNLMNFSLRNVLMEQQDRSLTVVIPRAKIRPASRPSSRPTQSSLPPVPTDPAAEMAASEQKLLRYLEQGAMPAQTHQCGGPGPSGRPPPVQGKSFRKLSLQEQRKISSGALVSSGTEVSAQGGMRRRSTGLPIHEHEPPYRPHEPEFRSFDQSYRPPPPKAEGASRASVSSYRCKPPSYCGYSESHGHTMNEKDGASTVYTTQGKLFRMSHDYDSNSMSE